MYYEDAIKEEVVEVKEDIASFIGKKAEDAIAKFGTDYTMSGMSLYFANAQISFALGNYSGTLLGTEEIVAINTTFLVSLVNVAEKTLFVKETFSVLPCKLHEIFVSYSPVDGNVISSLYVYSVVRFSLA